MVDLVAAAAGVLWAHVSLVPSSRVAHSNLGVEMCNERCGAVRGFLRDGVSTTSGGLAAGAAVPDTDGLALDSVLAAELAHVAGVLCDLGRASISCPLHAADCLVCTHFHLLDLLTERGTVTGTVLSGDADLLSAYIAINIVFLIARAVGAAVRLVILAVLCGLTGGLTKAKVLVVGQFRSCGQRGGLAGFLAALCHIRRAFLTDQPSPT